MKRIKFGRDGGFTLVELMATVAIVGVLAAIAVPNYIRYQRKARQTEAKIALSSLFTLEASAKQAPETGNSFHMCLSAMGAAVMGNSYYASGFHSGISTTYTSCGPGGAPTPSCLAYSWNSGVASATCAEGDGTTYFNATTYDTSNVSVTAAATGSSIIQSMSPPTSVTAAAFTIGAAGFIGGSNANGDQWQVNEKKSIYQLTDGVN